MPVRSHRPAICNVLLGRGSLRAGMAIENRRRNSRTAPSEACRRMRARPPHHVCTVGLRLARLVLVLEFLLVL